MSLQLVNAVLSKFSHAVEDEARALPSRYLTQAEKLKKITGEDDDSLSGASNIRNVRPWNYFDFQGRLDTFRKPSNWFAKPVNISAVECARHGWCNTGANELSCMTCLKVLKHEEADTTGRILKKSLRNDHESFCGWTGNFCPESFADFQQQPSETNRRLFLDRLISILQLFRKNIQSMASIRESVDKLIIDFRVPLETISTFPEFIEHFEGLGIISGDNVTRVIIPTETDKATLLCNRLERIAGIVLALKNGTASIGFGFNTEETALQILLKTMLTAVEAPSGLTADIDSAIGLETGTKQLVFVSILFALFGWGSTASSRAAISSFASVSSGGVGLNSPDKTFSTPISSSSGHSDNLAGTASRDRELISCRLCGRCVDVWYFAQTTSPIHSNPATSSASPVAGSEALVHSPQRSVLSQQESHKQLDPLSQHRAYCPWAHVNPRIHDEDEDDLTAGSMRESVDALAGRQAGWRLCMRELGVAKKRRRISGSVGAEAAKMLISPTRATEGIVESIPAVGRVREFVSTTDPIVPHEGEAAGAAAAAAAAATAAGMGEAAGNDSDFAEDPQQAYKKIRGWLDLASAGTNPRHIRSIPGPTATHSTAAGALGSPDANA